MLDGFRTETAKSLILIADRACLDYALPHEIRRHRFPGLVFFDAIALCRSIRATDAQHRWQLSTVAQARLADGRHQRREGYAQARCGDVSIQLRSSVLCDFCQ